MVGETSRGEESPIKPDTVGHARREKKEIAGGDTPGKCTEKPDSQPVGQVARQSVEEYFHAGSSGTQKKAKVVMFRLLNAIRIIYQPKSGGLPKGGTRFSVNCIFTYHLSVPSDSCSLFLPAPNAPFYFT
jgi:hypothetical protein